MPAALDAALEGLDADGATEVWHLAANLDIRAGGDCSDVDFSNTFLVTHTLLKAMRRRNWRRLHFASTSAVYGDHGDTPLSEETCCRPISNYGAMKAASEAAIGAASEHFLEWANVFRFPNVVGVSATHGVIWDFLEKLKKSPDRLSVLGDGSQRNAYLHVHDLVAGMLWIRDMSKAGLAIYNIGPRHPIGNRVSSPICSFSFSLPKCRLSKRPSRATVRETPGIRPSRIGRSIRSTSNIPQPDGRERKGQRAQGGVKVIFP